MTTDSTVDVQQARQIPPTTHKKGGIVRPNIHITSPLGWLNDPCAPGYDSSTGLYHLFYQCNPHGVNWGNMSWGHATTKDLLYWKYAPVHTPLKPDKKYDREGVFTGCLGPLNHKGELSIFYTSIRHLPFHWTDPAPRGSAGLALATSADDGVTWEKSKSNPILEEEPAGLHVTGFRDPYLAAWPALDWLRGREALYGLISGGIMNEGPTSFVYAVDPTNIKKWEYLGPLVDIEARWQPSLKWEGNYGVNWECVNFMTIKDQFAVQDFLILGSEGDVAREHLHERNLPPGMAPRTIRSQQWMAADLVKVDTGFRMMHRYGGILDHGIYYAANSFEDPVSGRRIVYGWIPEEDCTEAHAQRKGWNGCQAFPREVFLQSIVGVVGALRSPLETIASIGRSEDSSKSTTIHTMGIRPIAELDKICSNAVTAKSFTSVSVPEASKVEGTYLASTKTPTWCLKCSISVNALSGRSVGFHVRHSADMLTYTTITFSLVDESITVNRSHSAPQHPEFNSCDETGPFTLFRTRMSSDDCEILESLQIQILSDGDVLEVFANDRFALATMVYAEHYEENGGITVFAEGDPGCATVENLTIWDGLNEDRSCITYEGEEEEDGDDKEVVQAFGATP